MSDLRKTKRVESGEFLKPQNLSGVIIPLVTPYSIESDEPKVDVRDLTELVQRVIPFANGLFPAGNAGEGPSLDLKNYETLLDTVVQTRDKYSLNRIPVLAGVLKKSSEEIEQFCKTANKACVDGVIVAPMYGGNPESSLQAVLRATDKPVILYNNPALHDDLELPIEFVKWARDNSEGRVIGIKSSSKKLSVFEEVLELKNDSFKVFQGHTPYDAVALEAGADGIVPVEANAWAMLMQGLWSTAAVQGVAFRDRTEKVDTLLKNLKQTRNDLNLGSAEVVKYYLHKTGVFKSTRMYQG